MNAYDEAHLYDGDADDPYEDPNNCWWCGEPLEDHVHERDVYWCFGGSQ